MIDIKQFEQQSGMSLNAIFNHGSQADLQWVISYLASIPDQLAHPLFFDFICDYQKSSSRNIQNLKHAVKVKATHIKTDLKWMKQQLQRLPENTAFTLKNEYIRRRMKCNNGRSANIWLRKSVKFLHDVSRSIPIPLYHFNTDSKRSKVANEWSNRCLTLLNNMTYQQDQQVDAAELVLVVKQPADMWRFCPALPDLDEMNKRLKQGKDISNDINCIANALARLIDEAWWKSQIERALKQYQEHTAIIIGKVRSGVSPYVSHRTLQDYQTKKKRNASWLQAMQIVNEPYELEFPLMDAVKASISNHQNRRVELMVRMRGFEKLAEKYGYIGEFYTWTAPSKYHSWNKGKAGKSYANSLYLGVTPSETQKYLCKQWAKVRAKLEREHIYTFGFRVVEPHHDGTPHWHLLLFFKPEHITQARQILCDYAVEHDKEELDIKSDTFTVDDCRPRFDYKTIDAEKGSATGYIAKYIAKNIDGAYVDIDYEAQRSGKHAAEAVAAWASTWHIRQFQQIGGASVTVWRELRRLKQVITNDDAIEKARKAADTANWQSYIEANGGLHCKRCHRPVKLAKIVKQAANRYGEDITKITGIMAKSYVSTRLEGWELRKLKQTIDHIDKTSKHIGDACSLSSDSCAYWRSDNNCTDNILDIVSNDELLVPYLDIHTSNSYFSSA